MKRLQPYKRLADIFSKMNRSKQNQFLKGLEEHNEEAAEQIRGLMFTFEDLVRVEAEGIQELLRQVDHKQLAAAMKGAPIQVKELFFENMSERTGKLLREDMGTMGGVRMTEVEKAQESIVSFALSLADAGKIMIKDSEEDEYIV